MNYFLKKRSTFHFGTFDTYILCKFAEIYPTV